MHQKGRCKEVAKANNSNIDDIDPIPGINAKYKPENDRNQKCSYKIV